MNAKTPTGVTALSAAVLKRHTSVVRALLAAGTDEHVRDPAGETPILLAAKFEGSVTVEQPGRAVAGIPGAPPPPAGAGPANPGSRPARPSRSASMSAAGAAPAETIRNLEPELVALLLEAGAESNSADRTGRTLLMFAAAQGWLELVQVLLAGGADVEAKAGQREDGLAGGDGGGGRAGATGGEGEAVREARSSVAGTTALLTTLSGPPRVAGARYVLVRLAP